MAEALSELFMITCGIYLIGAGLMGIVVYLLIAARLIDYIRHPDEEEDEY